MQGDWLVGATLPFRGYRRKRRKGCRRRVVEGIKAMLSLDVLNLKGQAEASGRCLKPKKHGPSLVREITSEIMDFEISQLECRGE